MITGKQSENRFLEASPYDDDGGKYDGKDPRKIAPDGLRKLQSRRTWTRIAAASAIPHKRIAVR